LKIFFCNKVNLVSGVVRPPWMDSDETIVYKANHEGFTTLKAQIRLLILVPFEERGFYTTRREN
jgi:hypothetical protein